MTFDIHLLYRDWPAANHSDDARLARVDWPAEEVSDNWLDEALRTVPLPSGFLDRMSVLAQPIFTDHFDADGRSESRRVAPAFDANAEANGHRMPRRRDDGPLL